ncbi:gfo/Idh/MocA family oxidoreductase [Halalkalibacillus sediminis]|uniref:Gfo/Idh/MocA family oxidoreductase n=1 Tax=Halalkalibacillus sediminis TaxID=2018042 RepID=A0A2I0QR63_9BACI|nr:Gfo/Idh/MocA family oxidoreductase [Halalkalibacillus sediminis]PKR76822.1 gfo/Idh/MocA family oxidoreductase [Halalkalibacillus sediminis]
MRKVKFGILSTANIAKKALIPAMKRAENVELVAISSGSGKAKQVAEELDIAKSYESYDELLQDPEIEAVYIPLPNHLHKEWVFKAAEAGKHILCEKPAGLNVKEVDEMEEVCEKHGVQFMEAFMYQFHSQHERVREIIESGEIGDVKLMKASFSFPLTKPDGNIRVDAEKGGGSIYDVGSYCLHTFRTILDEVGDEVWVQGSIDSKFKVETSATGMVRMKSGVEALFDCSFHTSLRHEYEVIGTEGTIRVPRAYRPDAFAGEGHVIVEKGNSMRTERHYSDQYMEEVVHFSDVVMNGGELRNSFRDSKENMQFIDACYESLKNGKSVKV